MSVTGFRATGWLLLGLASLPGTPAEARPFMKRQLREILGRDEGE